MVAGLVYLVDFTERQLSSERTDCRCDIKISGKEGFLQGHADKKISDKHSDMIVPDGIDCRAASTQWCLVYNIVMNQRGIVEHLDCGGAVECGTVDASKQLRAQENHYGTYLFPFGGEIVGYNLVHERVGGMKRMSHALVELLQLRSYGVEYVFKCGH